MLIKKYHVSNVHNNQIVGFAELYYDKIRRDMCLAYYNYDYTEPHIYHFYVGSKSFHQIINQTEIWLEKLNLEFSKNDNKIIL